MVRREQEVTICGQSLVLMPERAVFWREGSTLFVADVHLGKAATFRAQGIAVPGGSTEGTLRRLTDLLNGTCAERLVILGDLWHAKAGRTEEVMLKFSEWRNSHAQVEITLVEGNHDRRTGKLPPDSQICEVQEPYEFGPFALCHYPETTVPFGYRLAGHLHPGVLLEGKGRQSLRLPCFLFSPDGAILPAFGDFTGLALVQPTRDDQVFVLAQDSVIRVG